MADCIHHWLIKFGTTQGRCRRCGEVKTFPTLAWTYYGQSIFRDEQRDKRTVCAMPQVQGN